MARILVIEDEMAMREAIRKIAVSAGHEVSVASNGKEGLARIGENPPALVITDIFMPEKDGVETIVTLRKMVPDIKIIAVSGGGRATNFDFLNLAGTVGADATLKKPLRMAELIDCINRLLGPSKSNAPG